MKKSITAVMTMMLVMGMLFLSGCSDSSTSGSGNGLIGGDGNNGAVHFGNTLKLSGQVYLYHMYNIGSNNSIHTKFEGDAEIIHDEANGVGRVTNGKLSYEVGIPQYVDHDLEYIFGESIQKSPDNVQCFEWYVETDFYNDYNCSGSLARFYVNISSINPSLSGTVESVNYIYVDGDVRVWSGDYLKEGTYQEDGITYISNHTRKAFDITLREGWNAIYRKSIISSSGTETSITETNTTTYELKNPDIIWVIQIDDPSDIENINAINKNQPFMLDKNRSKR